MGLRVYIIRRFLFLIPTFFISSIIIFSLIHLAPGDPVTLMYTASGHPPPPETIERIREELGFNKPIIEQYFMWVVKMLQGDFGVSYASLGQKVTTIVGSRVVATLELMLMSMILSVGLSVILGATAAVKQYSIMDNLSSVIALFGYSMPSFWLALVLILIFSFKLGWFPIFGAHSVPEPINPFAYFVDHLLHLILPVFTVSVTNTAYIFRLVRSSMLDVLKQDYVTTARSIGVRERVVIYKYALKNAILPVVTYVGLMMGFLLMGAVVVETIFSWPGLGQLLVQFALSRDYSSIMGLSMIIVIMVYIANLCADLAYAVIDPRIRLG